MSKRYTDEQLALCDHAFGLMEKALGFLDGADAQQAAQVLDHAITLVPAKDGPNTRIRTTTPRGAEDYWEGKA